MLSPGSRVVYRTFFGASSPLRGPQSSRYLGPLRRQLHVQQWTERPAVPNTRSILSLRTSNWSPLGPYFSFRSVSTTGILRKDVEVVRNDGKTDGPREEILDNTTLEFERTEKGEAAKEVDLSARLKDRSSQSEKGEVIRLLKLAAREWKTLSGSPISSTN
jgi:hypothetical protein